MSAENGAETDRIEAAASDAFQQMTAPFMRELHVHCYRMLGSVLDAEDAVQKALLRAWRHLPDFQGRSSYRAWLYRIATNVCLTERTRARGRPAPPAYLEAFVSGDEPAVHLSPYPDSLLDELPSTAGNPAADYDLRESVQLAFLAAVQLLPARQRAVLILRDVAGWRAREVAELLDMTTAGVNSALQRGRAALARQREAGRLFLGCAVPTGEDERLVAGRYIEAFNAGDIGRLAALLKDDAVLTMPPLPVRREGREAVSAFLAGILAAVPGDRFRLVVTRANRQPALAVYRLDGSPAAYRAWGVLVLTLDGAAIASIAGFNDPELLPWFGLPPVLATRAGTSW